MKAKYLLLYIQCLEALAIGGNHWEHGEIAAVLLSEDFSVLKDLGSVFFPQPNDYWQSHRLLAGCLWAENKNSLYFFHGGSPNRPNLLHESIGFAKGKVTDEWEFEWQPSQPLKFIDWDKHYDYSHEQNYPDERHRQWRDPFIVSHQGKYWMFISAAAKTNSPLFKGCIGLAVADHLEGPYTALPPVVFPHFDGEKGEEGLFYECERSHVVYQGGKWHLFFCVWRKRVNPRWLEKIGPQANSISDSSLYHYVSSQIEGPYHPVKDVPVVEGSLESNLFAINFLKNHQEELIAYGSDIKNSGLDVSGQWQVLWQSDVPQLKKISLDNHSGKEELKPQFRREGHVVWDAMLLKLPD